MYKKLITMVEFILISSIYYKFISFMNDKISNNRYYNKDTSTLKLLNNHLLNIIRIYIDYIIISTIIYYLMRCWNYLNI